MYGMSTYPNALQSLRDIAVNKTSQAAQARTFYQHWHRVGIRAADLDDQHHVNNTVFGVYCEEGRRMFLTPQRKQFRSEQLMLFVARLAMDFHREMNYPGEVEIGSTVTRVGNSSYTMTQGLFTADGCHATAEVVMVVADHETRRPKAIPTGLRDYLTQQLSPALRE